jgi:hypothetical protein
MGDVDTHGIIFTSLAVRNELLRESFFFEGFLYDVTPGVRKRFIICEDSWDARCSVAFSQGCIKCSFLQFSSLFSSSTILLSKTIFIGPVG